jgi:hypothetical protein
MNLGIGWFRRKHAFKDTDEIIIYKKRTPGVKGQLAMVLIEKMVLADSTCQQPVAEIVSRACEIADQGVDALEEREWFLELPNPPE